MRALHSVHSFLPIPSFEHFVKRLIVAFYLQSLLYQQGERALNFYNSLTKSVSVLPKLKSSKVWMEFGEFGSQGTNRRGKVATISKSSGHASWRQAKAYSC